MKTQLGLLTFSNSQFLDLEHSRNIDLQKIPVKHGISETCRTHKEKFQNDTLIVRNWLYEAVSFIKNNAEDKYELMLADKLCRMMNEGKVQLDDVSKRYERAGLENASAYGYPELIMTLAHEGWHAVQEENGIIRIDEHNNISFSIGATYDQIEKDAYCMGDTMYKKYMKQNAGVKR